MGAVKNLALTPQEERFVERYVETNNAAQSAIVAGYSPRSSRTTSSRLLARANIKEAIARRNAEIMDALDFQPDRIIREIAKVAGVNSADFITMEEVLDDEGNVVREVPIIDFSRVNRRHLAAVSSVENTEKGIKYKTHDKLKALDMLAKLARMYPAERTELSGPGGGPLQTMNAHVHKIDIQSLEPEQRQVLRDMLLQLKNGQGDSEPEEA